jgi:hypothetical protein
MRALRHPRHAAPNVGFWANSGQSWILASCGYDANDRFCCKSRRLFERDAYRDFLGRLPATGSIESGGLDAVTLTFKGITRSKSVRLAEVGRPAWRAFASSARSLPS